MCCRNNKKLRKYCRTLFEKQKLIHQLQENAIDLRRKADQSVLYLSDLEVAREELELKSRELMEVQDKLNENYSLVAKLSSENLKLSNEKLIADNLVTQVVEEQGRLKEELTKAINLADALKDKSASSDSSKICNNPGKRWPEERGFMRSSPETSSSFDFIPQHSERQCSHPATPVPMNSESNQTTPKNDNDGRKLNDNIRNNANNRYFYNRRRGGGHRRWKSHGYSSDNPQTGALNPNSGWGSKQSPKHRNRYRNDYRPQSSASSGITISNEVSSPDLGIGSDCFSSLERCQGPVSRIIEENRRLNTDNEKLNNQVKEYKGVLRKTIDKMSDQRVYEKPVLPETSRNKLFPPSKQSDQDQRAQIKKEFLEFSRSHSNNRKSGRGGKRSQSFSKSNTRHKS